MVDEIEVMSKSISELFAIKEIWKNGYNKSQETNPFSEDDMIKFLEWYKNHLVQYPTKELLQIWKDQQIKTVYYE